MKCLGTFSFYILIIGFFISGIVTGSTADWAYQRSYSHVDLMDNTSKSIGYSVEAPILYPDDMLQLSNMNESGWKFDMGEAGEFTLITIPDLKITNEQEFFEIHERDESFIGQPFERMNLYYDGLVYSCWGKAGGTRIRYDCARFITGDFFKISATFENLDEALRNNLKLRKIILTVSKNDGPA